MPIPGRGRELDIEPLNLTPLLDCILNLIFFFLCATQIKKEAQPTLRVELPEAAMETRATELEKPLRITIAANGGILLNEDAVTSAQLEARLTELGASGEEPPPVFVITDKKTNMQAFINVAEICTRTGHTNFQVLLEDRPRAP